uniref:3HCDH_N domain-containing protein n=1 Tax=Macrostomum lignano TaxID=282301 RepID=A0A1I8JE54_9PLAT
SLAVRPSRPCSGRGLTQNCHVSCKPRTLRAVLVSILSFLAGMSETRKVTIFGSGLVGCQWAMLFAAAGFQVALHDAKEGQAARALQQIDSQLRDLSAKGHLRGCLSAEQQQQLISAPGSLDEALDGAFLVQECVFEDVQVKRDVFRLLDAKAPAEAFLCSSTSCIMPSEFTSELPGRARCLVAHPVNPPYFLSLVELVPSPFTDPAAVQTVKETLVKLGQEPIVMTCGLAPRYCFLGPLAVMQTNASGIRDYCQRFGSGVARVSATFGPTPTYQGEEVDRVAAQMNTLMPPESLADVCARRNQFLAALARMKRDFSQSRGSQDNI